MIGCISVFTFWYKRPNKSSQLQDKVFAGQFMDRNAEKKLSYKQVYETKTRLKDHLRNIRCFGTVTHGSYFSIHTYNNILMCLCSSSWYLERKYLEVKLWLWRRQEKKKDSFAFRSLKTYKCPLRKTSKRGWNHGYH